MAYLLGSFYEVFHCNFVTNVKFILKSIPLKNAQQYFVWSVFTKKFIKKSKDKVCLDFKYYFFDYLKILSEIKIKNLDQE